VIRSYLRAGLAVLLFPLCGYEAPAQETRFPAREPEVATLRIHAATDLGAMEPLIRDFQALRPDVAILYDEGQTVDVFAQAQRDCRSARSSADLLLSSSTDQLVRLANDGCALAAPSTVSSTLPSWTRWRNEVFGFTFEPGVIVYNRNVVPPEDVRRTRATLIELLRAKPDAYNGRVGIYDIERSGIGYLFALYDARETTVYGRLLEAFARANVSTSCCTAELLSDISAGRLAIGYNLLGSYAVAAARKGAPLVIIVPRDFTVVLSRSALVPTHAANSQAAFAFLAYLLSSRGQRKAVEASFFFSFDGPMPGEVDGPATLTSSALFRPIEVSAEALFVQDRAKRARFTSEWRRSLHGAPSPR
jgi:iron(III) transport system substrate-binding protein